MIIGAASSDMALSKHKSFYSSIMRPSMYKINGILQCVCKLDSAEPPNLIIPFKAS